MSGVDYDTIVFVFCEPKEIFEYIIEAVRLHSGIQTRRQATCEIARRVLESRNEAKSKSMEERMTQNVIRF